MFYIIYETTNIVTGKRYIGKHITNTLNDGYLGSGLYLGHAIKKYGRDKFIRKILYQFDNEIDMNLKEIEIVTLDVVSDEMYYNIALGGQGGIIVLKEGHPLYNSTCEKISKSLLNNSKQISERVKKLHEDKKVGMYGKSQTDYQKQRVSDVQTGRIKTDIEIAKHKESYYKTINDPDYIHPNKNKTKPKKLCTHCGREIDNGNYVRYHGDKCKLK